MVELHTDRLLRKLSEQRPKTVRDKLIFLIHNAFSPPDESENEKCWLFATSSKAIEATITQTGNAPLLRYAIESPFITELRQMASDVGGKEWQIIVGYNPSSPRRDIEIHIDAELLRQLQNAFKPPQQSISLSL